MHSSVLPSSEKMFLGPALLLEHFESRVKIDQQLWPSLLLSPTLGMEGTEQAYLKQRRYRTVDVFMEIDKDHSNHIDINEFTRFIKCATYTPANQMMELTMVTQIVTKMNVVDDTHIHVFLVFLSSFEK